METTWKYVKPLEDSGAIKSFLKQQKVSLPDSLIDIMEKNNGGRPSEKDIITKSHKEYVFKSMLSYNKDDKETIYSVYPELFKETNLFPIASDAAGNFICYDLKSKRYALYNHEIGKSEDIEEIVFDDLESKE